VFSTRKFLTFHFWVWDSGPQWRWRAE
jgi:hypothetical protein